MDQIEWLAQKRSEGYVAAFLVRKALREMQERKRQVNMATDEEYLDALDTLRHSDRAKLDPLCLALIEKFEAELAKRRQADAEGATLH